MNEVSGIVEYPRIDWDVDNVRSVLIVPPKVSCFAIELFLQY